MIHTSRLIFAAVMFSLAACSTPPYLISRENVEASKPPRVAITSITSTDRGARIVAFAFAPVEIATFLRQLEAAGAANVQVVEIKPLSACERRVMRAEFKIEGDSRPLVEVASSAEQLRLLLSNGKGDFECILHLPM